MKTKENIKNNKKNIFCKSNPSGISLIVLVITIIVIIILATAVILTLNNNNPIEGANNARYESDVANMQAIFTNAVAKVMAQNQGTVEVNAGELNSVKVVENGVISTEGRVNYTVNAPQDNSNKNGIIVFDIGTNNATTFYTGRKLPLYKAGKITWYVDSDGVISLQVGKLEFGKGEKVENPVVEEKEVIIKDTQEPIMKQIRLDSFDCIPRKITKIKFLSADKVSKEKERLTDISQNQDKSVMAWLEDSGRTLILASKNGKIIANQDASNLFYDLKKLTNIENLQFLDVSQSTNMQDMFRGCTNLLNLDISGFNTSNATSIASMFYNCNNLQNIDFGSNFDTSNVTDMRELFYNCYNLEEINLGNKFDTSKTKHIYRMFESCRKLVNINLGEKFNTENINNMMYMFSGCSSLENLNLGNNFNTNNVTDMSYMFRGCSNLNTLELGKKFNTENVEYMSYMFEGCNNLTSFGKNYEFNISSSFAKNMFANCKKLTATLNLNTSVSFYNNMFYNAATIEPAKITINYRSNGSFEEVYKTKSDNSNIVKGKLLQ